jgi:hypothetical protein
MSPPNRNASEMLVLKGRFVLMVLAISLALTPSLVAASYTINIRTDKQTYHVGEKWAGVFWSPNGACINLGRSTPSTGTLVIDGPSTHTTANLFQADLRTGSYTPSIGSPWVAGDVGNWTVKFTVGDGGYCTASGATAFQVSS